MWTILLDGHDLLLLRDSWRRARIAGLTKEHRSSSRLAPFPCSMTRETARNQLKSVFAKTDTHRQSELVALLLQVG
jgi:hypothetical protein